MSNKISNSAVLDGTGKTPDEWYRVLDEVNGRDLSHPEPARLREDRFGLTSWWSQEITVLYERHIGRRNRRVTIRRVKDGADRSFLG